VVPWPVRPIEGQGRGGIRPPGTRGFRRGGARRLRKRWPGSRPKKIRPALWFSVLPTYNRYWTGVEVVRTLFRAVGV